jgi:hypothetical protein
MATLNFSFDTGNVPVPEIVDAFASAYRYEETIDGQPNPESKAAFARRMIKNYIRDIYISEKRKVEEAKITKFDLDLT